MKLKRHQIEDGLIHEVERVQGYAAHAADKENPHEVTAEQAGTYSREEIDELNSALANMTYGQSYWFGRKNSDTPWPLPQGGAVWLSGGKNGFDFPSNCPWIWDGSEWVEQAPIVVINGTVVGISQEFLDIPESGYPGLARYSMQRGAWDYFPDKYNSMDKEIFELNALRQSTIKDGAILPRHLSALVSSAILDMPYPLGIAPFISSAPPPFLFADTDRRQLVLKAGLRLNLPSGESFIVKNNYIFNAETSLDAGSFIPGRDYYVFLCSSGSDSVLRVSLSKSNPQGFSPVQVLLIGGFHTLCVDVGGALNMEMGNAMVYHELNYFSAGDILPRSVWCLNHRPYSQPEGMVYIPPLDFWCDIYLQSNTGWSTRSDFRGDITQNRQYVDFVEDQLCVNKSLLNDEEFSAAMLGSNERSAVAGANEAGSIIGGAGGRVDTAQRRMISTWGVEEGCGSLWQFLATTSASGGNAWSAQNGGRGAVLGAAHVLMAGGYWGNGINCGSRARHANAQRGSAAERGRGARGRSRPQNLAAY